MRKPCWRAATVEPNRGVMTGSQTIGIMADSHGNPEMIATALAYFKARGCRYIVHLGDICDSVAYQRANRCVELLREWNVRCIKGNNDHAIVHNGMARHTGGIAPDTLAYLEALPLEIETTTALFVHSRPFTSLLGMAAMTGDIDQAIVDRFIMHYPGKMLFRGHGHSPRVMDPGAQPGREVSPGAHNHWELDSDRGYIVTCGALYKGLCMTWDPAANILESHRLATRDLKGFSIAQDNKEKVQ